MEIKYNNGLRSGGVSPSLLVVTPEHECYLWEGDTDQNVTILAEDYEKNGKWSNTTFRLLLAKGVQAVTVCAPAHGEFLATCATWEEVADSIGLNGVNPYKVREAIATRWPNTTKRIDNAESAQMAADDDGEEMSKLTISFGAPSRKNYESFWNRPLCVINAEGAVVGVLRPQTEGRWTTPLV